MWYIVGGRRVWIGVIAVSLAVLAAGLALWRSRPNPDATAYMRREVAARGQEVYKRLKVEPIFSNREAVLAVVSQAPRSHYSVETNAPLDPLFELYADFVYYRFGQPDVETYKKWRVDHGYRWRSMRDLIETWFVKDTYTRYFPDRQIPENPTPEQLFNEYWTVGLDWHPEVNRPVAICTDEDGLRVSAAIATPGNPRAGVILGEDDEQMIWHGAVVTGGRCWFDPPRSREQIMAQYGKVTNGQVAAIIEFQGGYRCPLVVSALWDPASNQWMMETILLYNREIENRSAVEY